MIKKIIALTALVLVLLNIPGIVLETQSIAISSPISYLSFLLLIILVVTEKSKYPKQLKLFAVITCLYFFIGAFNYQGDLIILVVKFIKSILYLFGLFVSLKYVNKKTLLLIFVIGGITIVLDSLFFRFNDFTGDSYISEYGRYSGFYLNPNTASVICIFGYLYSLTLNGKWKLLTILFTFFGILTLSRTFIITWFLVSLVYLYYNRKLVIKMFFFLIIGSIGLISFNSVFRLDTARFDFITGLFVGKINTEVLNDDSRQDQWAKFYDHIMDSPIIGNGFQTFSTSLTDKNGQGVHNSFLLIFGESGFLPFLLILALFIWLLYSSFIKLRQNSIPFLLTISFTITLLVSHVLFSSGVQIFILTFIIHNLTQEKNKQFI